ncbi:hypothetical protein AH02_32 [Pseudomonas phage AH02]|nr:hypothetical protein AH02_32 [Pseudomonas phage AH02]
MNNQTKTGAMVMVSSLERFEADGEDFVKLGDVRDIVAMLAAPEQPPAVGGEPEAVGWRVGGFNFNAEAFALDYAKWMEEEEPVKYLIDRAHVAPLLAENQLLKHEIASFLETMAITCDALGIDLDEAKHADGKPSDVLLEHARKLQSRIAELEAGQGEPVVWLVSYKGDDAHYFTLRNKDRAEKYKSNPGYVVTPLYRQPQPAKAKVVLPDRCDDGGTGGADYYIAVGWNACLDTTAKLNGGAE